MRKGFLWVFAVTAAACFTSGCQQKSNDGQISQINSPAEPAGTLTAERQVSTGQDANKQIQIAQSQEQPHAIQFPETDVPAAGEALEREVVSPSAQEIQHALKNAGFYSGDIDAKVGPKTKKAIEDFQAKNGLTVDGKVGRRTWDKLKEYLNMAGASHQEAGN